MEHKITSNSIINYSGASAWPLLDDLLVIYFYIFIFVHIK